MKLCSARMAGQIWERPAAAARAARVAEFDADVRLANERRLLQIANEGPPLPAPVSKRESQGNLRFIVTMLGILCGVAGLVLAAIVLGRQDASHRLPKNQRVSESDHSPGEAQTGFMGIIHHLTPEEEGVDARFLSFRVRVDADKLEVYRNNTGYPSTAFSMKRAKASEGGSNNLPDLKYTTRVTNQSVATVQITGPSGLLQTHTPLVTSAIALNADGRFNAYAMAGGNNGTGGVIANVILVQENPDGNAQYGNRDANFKGDVDMNIQIMMVRKALAINQGT